MSKHIRDIIHFHTPTGGKRRMYIWAGSLRILLKPQQHHQYFLDDIRSSPLRAGNDYLIEAQHHDLRLTLSATLALLVMTGTPRAWTLYHQLADTIQGGFNRREV